MPIVVGSFLSSESGKRSAISRRCFAAEEESLQGALRGVLMAKRKGRAAKSEAVTFETVRRIALTFPGTAEGTSYGTFAFKVRGKLFVRLHQSEPSIVVRIDVSERAMRMRADPHAFYITDHYVTNPWMLVRLSAVWEDDLRVLLEDAWRHVASRRLIAEFDDEAESGQATCDS